MRAHADLRSSTAGFPHAGLAGLLVILVFCCGGTAWASKPLDSPQLQTPDRLSDWPVGAPIPASRTPAEGGQPISLAAVDLDQDGVADLVCGRTGPEGHGLTLHRGNVEAILPHSPEARQLPFLEPARSFESPTAPDLLAVGDFDNDGHPDVAAAALGASELLLFLGDGRGELGGPEPVALPGVVTAMVAGEINRADGLVDLAVGLVGQDGPLVAVFEGPEGALRSAPEILSMPEAPRSLLLARLAEGPWHDLALAAGSDLIVVRGRDRRLMLGQARRDEVQAPSIETLAMPRRIESLAWGDFARDAAGRRELALLLDDGSLHLVSRGPSVETPAAGQADAAGSWTTIGRRELPTRGSGSTMLTVRLGGAPTDDLAIFDPVDRRARLLSRMARGSLDPTRLADPGTLLELDLGEAPTAALAMRLNADALSDLVLLQPGAGVPVVVPSAPQATIVVDSAADSTIPADGACTLREALTNANADADTTAGDCAAGAGVDAISFAIFGGGAPATIALLSALPVISDTLTLDGTSQGCANPPCIVLNGALAGGVAAGLQLDAGSCSVRGFVIQRFSGVSGDPALNAYGIWIRSSGNMVEGNFCGTDLTGTIAQSNDGAGVRIDDGSSNTIGGTAPGSGNVLSAALSGAGLNIIGDSEDNQALGNLIGTDVSGTVDLGNSSSGVGAQASNNTFGGASAGAGNLISGNGGNGIFMPAPVQGCLVLGNRIGTDAGGSTALGNGSGFPGVWVDGANNTIGGAAVGAGNLVSGNPSSGVRLAGSGHQVLGNLIGTDLTGSVDLGNTSVGVRIQGGQGNTIGGTSPGARNVISGNDSDGVFLGGATQDNVILGNYIGTDATGTTALANGLVGIEIDGDAAANTIGGASPGAGNLISGNAQGGIFIQFGKQNLLEGNFIGTDASGTAAIGSGIFSAVEVWDSHNTIGGTAPGAGNLISGNELTGVFFNGVDAHDNQVLGNLIGTDVSGTLGLGNGFNGVEFQSASNNTVGGETAATRNVISDNQLNGVHMAGASMNVVRGNYIGTNAAGTAALGNALAGVRVVSSSNNTIGGTTAGARNVISGNETVGVRIAGFSGQDNVVLGNFIGTDAGGTVALGNLLAGVEIESGSNNTIGGTVPGAGNVISGNGDVQGWGVVLEGASNNEIQGNLIGLTADGSGPLPNRFAGVATAAGASQNTIGGTGVTPGRCDGPCNRIAFTSAASNDSVRILSGSGSGNAILGNSIHSSAALGIDLEADGVSANDPGDGDAGANDVQNFPVLSLAEATPATVTLEGSLDSAPNRPFRIEFFANLACDGSGYGEGARFLGFADVSTDATGIANFSVSPGGPVSHAEAISATATNLAGSTSEFSECLAAICLSTAGFGQTVAAQDADSLIWELPDDVRYARGDLEDVGSYTITATGELPGATSLDISADDPGEGQGFYYVVRSLACGSWQTTQGAEPARDSTLP